MVSHSINGFSLPVSGHLERESRNEKSALDTVVNTEHFTYLVLQVTWLFFENGNSLLSRIGLIPNRDRVCILN